LRAFPPGGFGVEGRFHQLWVKKNAPADFTKGERSVPLLVPNPTQTWPAGFVEKNFEKPWRGDVARRD